MLWKEVVNGVSAQLPLWRAQLVIWALLKYFIERRVSFDR